jgi:glycosyltransferase involved in cell wall biosynthesis
VQATIVITTRNRSADLRTALRSALAQSCHPEILVIDDGSTDGTYQMVMQEFPGVGLYRSEQSLGLIAQRNRAAAMVRSAVVISIDDDAVFSTADVVEQTLKEFSHPRVGAIAIPFVDVNRSSAIQQRAPRAAGVFATYSYIGTAHAVRRDLFLRLGGYCELLVHQGEEEDYCIRMLAAGYITRCGSADPIHHFESPRRSWERMDYYGSRNKVLYCWHHVPFPYAIGHLSATTVRTLAYNLRPRRLATRVRGVVAAYAMACSGRCSRHPVQPAIYRLSRRLKHWGAVSLDEIEPHLPELK